MDNVEKRLQTKLQRQITAEKEKQERIYIRNEKRIENGTKKIYYTILKEIIKNKNSENISIEFIDNDKSILYLRYIFINNKRIILGKTYFDFDKLKNLLEFYGLKIEYHGKRTSEDYCFLEESIRDEEYITGHKTKITGKRSKVCEHLLSLNPEQEVGSYKLPVEEPKTYTKQ